jgi:EAL domain-containing protein (putative c-di-GMP-specific phosphodiesterase class I)
VETEQQMQTLASLGCTRAQGYLFSRPQPPERLVSLLESRGRRAQAVMA